MNSLQPYKSFRGPHTRNGALVALRREEIFGVAEGSSNEWLWRSLML